jgi:hypothetical protein
MTEVPASPSSLQVATESLQSRADSTGDRHPRALSPMGEVLR